MYFMSVKFVIQNCTQFIGYIVKFSSTSVTLLYLVCVELPRLDMSKVYHEVSVCWNILA